MNIVLAAVKGHFAFCIFIRAAMPGTPGIMMDENRCVSLMC
jgi:hypothetical protein